MNPSKTAALRRLGLGVLCACAILGGLDLIFVYTSRQEKLRLSSQALKSSLHQWVKAGGPRGAALTEFMRGYPPAAGYLLVSNRSFTITGTNLTTMFAVTRYHLTMFITTNGILILLDESGEPKIVP
jgi:hypothetical protein